MASLRVTPPFLYTAATILPTVCTVLVVARFIIRGTQRAKVGWDDWLVLPGLVKENFALFSNSSNSTSFEDPRFRNGNRHYCGDRSRGLGASDAPHQSVAGTSRNEL